jgi:hypothetical protein
VYEVAQEQDLPLRFREAFGPWGGSELVLKVPIDVERRNARPGQDLYRQVLEIRGDTLRSLSLVEDQVVERSVLAGSILALTVFQALLLGTFSATTDDGEFAFTYNTVSSPLVDRFVDLIRARLSPPGSPPRNSAPLAVKNFFFQHLVREHERRSPGVRVVHCDEPGLRVRDDRGRSRKGLGLLVLETGSELLILDAGTPWKRPGRPAYGSRCLCLPRKSWKALTVEASSLNLSLTHLVLSLPLSNDRGRLTEALALSPPRP